MCSPPIEHLNTIARLFRVNQRPFGEFSFRKRGHDCGRSFLLTTRCRFSPFRRWKSIKPGELKPLTKPSVGVDRRVPVRLILCVTMSDAGAPTAPVQSLRFTNSLFNSQTRPTSRPNKKNGVSQETPLNDSFRSGPILVELLSVVALIVFLLRLCLGEDEGLVERGIAEDQDELCVAFRGFDFWLCICRSRT